MKKVEIFAFLLSIAAVLVLFSLGNTKSKTIDNFLNKLFSPYGKIESLLSDFFAPAGKSKLRKNLSEIQKICCFMSALSFVVLFLALVNVWRWFTLLRWLVCLTFAGKLIDKFSAGFKFFMLILAILYNPLAPVYFGDRAIWFWLNLITLPVIAIAEIITLQRVLKNGTSQKR